MSLNVGIVGAGLSGLVAARLLAEAGMSVTVYEKSRGLGGRMARRRLGEHDFDLGASHVTTRDSGPAPWIQTWSETGLLSAWGSPSVLAGRPGMNALAHHLADGLDLRFRTQVERLRRESEGWAVETSVGATARIHDAVLVAVPAPQAVRLLRPAPELALRADSVAMSPCWVALLAFEQRVPVERDRIVPASGPLAWCGRESSKPGRAPEPERWALHASSAWSERHLDAAPLDVAGALMGEFATVTGFAPGEPLCSNAHLWRYARAVRPLGQACLWDQGLGIGACGDWCLGMDLDAAHRSGAELAARVLRQRL